MPKSPEGLPPCAARAYALTRQFLSANSPTCRVKTGWRRPLGLRKRGESKTDNAASGPVALSIKCGSLGADLELARTVRRHIATSLPTGRLTLAQAARALGFSVRTLQRRLSLAGVTYRQLVDAARLEQALRLLDQSDLSITRIAFALGYANPGNFTRAFTRWHGLPPSAVRLRRRQARGR